MSAVGQKKSLLEIVLMPLVLAMLGVLGTYAVHRFQAEQTKSMIGAERERADRAAEAERLRLHREFEATMQVKLLEIFGERVLGGDLRERKNAVRLLRALDPEYAEKLLLAVGDMEPAERELQALVESERSRRIQLQVTTEPAAVRPGQKSKITVFARDGDGRLLSGARVTVSAGGGKFLREGEQFDPQGRLHAPYSVTGETNEQGVFVAEWVCNPCAAAYSMVAEAEKENFTPTKTEFRVSIVQ